jgi:purine-cytosine permease-like protein
MGLDLDAILPKLKRNQSTALVALISTLLVFIGKFVYDAESAVTNSVLFLTVLATSWLSITLYMFVKAKGVLSKESLQVFNAGETGGQYWFRNGWNLKAVAAWITGSAVGILGISSVDYVGPIAEFLHGIDVSIPVAGISSILTLTLLKAKGR